jgi:hypothetical protein
MMPMATPEAKASGVPWWERAWHWLTGAGHHLVQAAGWLSQRQHIAEVVVVGLPVIVLLGLARTLVVWRLLEERQQWAIVPTSRFHSDEKSDETAYKNFANALSHVRLRAVGRQWWLRRAGALRVRLDTINQGGTIYSMGGPPWAKTVVEVAGYQGLILVPLDQLDPYELSPKGLIVRPDVELADQEEETDSGLFPIPFGDPQ